MSEYRVALRHTTLLESAPLQDLGDERYFIATAAPPPTRSILTLHEGDAQQFFVVDTVFEVETGDQPRGVVGTLTDAQAHEEASTLGTEHLDDGEAPEAIAPAMAVPAPVIADDGDEDLDEAERQRLEGDDIEEENASAHASNEDERSSDDEDTSADGEVSDEDS